MLELHHSKKMTEEFWNSLPMRADLPCSPDQYLSKEGPYEVLPGSRRGYHRFYFRGIAVLRYGGTDYAGYCKDLSRLGIGLYSPIQLYPGDTLLMEVPGKDPLKLEVMRCVRIRERCYECGSRFTSST